MVNRRLSTDPEEKGEVSSCQEQQDSCVHTETTAINKYIFTTFISAYFCSRIKTMCNTLHTQFSATGQILSRLVSAACSVSEDYR